MTGNFSGTADFDFLPSATFNLTSSGAEDIYIARYGPSGIFHWAKKLGGTSSDVGGSVSVDRKYVYATGNFSGTADFDPSASTANLISSGQGDIYIAKYDRGTGNLIWAYSVGSNGSSGEDDIGNDISTDAIGNVYVTGQFYHSVDFDPSASTVNRSSAGNNDLFLAKYDKNGNYVWVWTLGGVYADSGLDLEIKSNAVYTTGFFTGTIDFDPSSSVYNLTNPYFPTSAFVAKYSECELSGYRTANEEFFEESVNESNTNAATEGWSLYPNPASEEIILIASGKEMEYEIADLAGAVMDKGVFTTNGEKLISISKFSPGTYLIKVGNKNNGYSYKKVIVVH